jgi:hypothetical protein
VPPLTSVVKTLTYVLNEAAYNPPGDDEGFLHWATWAVHNTNSVLSTQDANGAVIRSLVLFNCALARDPRPRPSSTCSPDRRGPCPEERRDHPPALDRRDARRGRHRLSVFGSRSFVWRSFGGVTPLQPEGYRSRARSARRRAALPERRRAASPA